MAQSVKIDGNYITDDRPLAVEPQGVTTVAGDVDIHVEGVPPGLDSSTDVLETIDYYHYEIHAGNHFYMEGHATLANGGTLFVKLVTPNTGRWGHLLWELHSSGILTTTLDEDATGGMAGGARPTIHANNRNINCWTGLHTGGNNVAVLVDATKAWTPGALVGYQIFNSTDGSSALITANDATTVTAALAGNTDNDWDTGDAYEINLSGMVITSAVTACTGYTQRVGNTSFGSRQAGGISSRVDEVVLKQNTVYCRSFTSGTGANIVGFKASWYEHTDH